MFNWFRNWHATRLDAKVHLRNAAPDLLRAAKVCLAAEQARRKKLKPGAPATEYSDKRIAMIVAAIAKAEGR